jgi:hypothetical protein
MAFDNHYPNRKDWRKKFHKAKAVDRTCRNHGSCPYCLGNRTHKHNLRKLMADNELKDFLKNLGEKFGSSEKND